MNPKKCMLLALCAALSLCSKLDNIVVRKSATATIPGGTNLKGFDAGFPDLRDISIIADTALTIRGVSRKEVDRAFLQSVTLSIIAPRAGQDFSFVQKVEFFLIDRDARRQLVAWGGAFPAGSPKVRLTCASTDLAKHIVADSVTIVAQFTGRAPPYTTDVQADVAFYVDANVSGIVCGAE